ncbi:MAG: AIR carboxylase family protein, partial [Candidatus Lokiarchaeia archaeon]|nr:AIR carboxylase family protein [Candidatus Lokiarchaeia archaeon]
MNKAQIAIMMGSKSDLPVMEETSKILKDFKIPFEITLYYFFLFLERTLEQFFYNLYYVIYEK